jgi:hypothetical protein
MKLANWSINHALMEYSSVQAMAEDRWSTCVAIGTARCKQSLGLGKISHCISNWFNHTNYHIFLIATNY